MTTLSNVAFTPGTLSALATQAYNDSDSSERFIVMTEPSKAMRNRFVAVVQTNCGLPTGVGSLIFTYFTDDYITPKTALWKICGRNWINLLSPPEKVRQTGEKLDQQASFIRKALEMMPTVFYAPELAEKPFEQIPTLWVLQRLAGVVCHRICTGIDIEHEVRTQARPPRADIEQPARMTAETPGVVTHDDEVVDNDRVLKHEEYSHIQCTISNCLTLEDLDAGLNFAHCGDSLWSDDEQAVVTRQARSECNQKCKGLKKTFDEQFFQTQIAPFRGVQHKEVSTDLDLDSESEE